MKLLVCHHQKNHHYYTIMMILLLLIAIVCAHPPPFPGGNELGITVDPITYETGYSIFDMTYTPKCITTDGVWLIPCGVSITPQSDVDIMSDVYTKTTDYNRPLTNDYTFDTDVLKNKVNGWYSKENLKIVKNMMNNITFVGSMAKIRLFEITTEIVTQLNPGFIKYIEVLHDKIKNNDMVEYYYWLSLFATDFKYTTVYRAYAGAKLQQFQYINDDYYKNTNVTIIKDIALAAAFFNGTFEKNNHSRQQIDEFIENSRDITTHQIGGVYIDGMTIERWSESAIKKPAIVDLILDRTSYWIRKELFPDKDPDIIYQISQDYENLMLEYINNNTRPGCTEKFTSNFILNATTNNDSCKTEYVMGSSFAGLYVDKYIVADNHWDWLGSTNNPLLDSGGCPANTHKNFNFSSINTDGNWNVESYCICETDNIRDRTMPSFFGTYRVARDAWGTFTHVNPFTNSASCPPGIPTQGGGWDDWATDGYRTCTSRSVPGYAYGGFVSNTSLCPKFAPKSYLFITDYNRQNSIYVCYGDKEQLINPAGTMQPYQPLYIPESPGYTIPAIDIIYPIMTTSHPNTPSVSHPKENNKMNILLLFLICGTAGITLVFMVLIVIYVKYRMNRMAFYNAVTPQILVRA